MRLLPVDAKPSALEPHLAEHVRELLRAGKPFSAILRVRDDMQIDLAEAKALVEAFVAAERQHIRTSIIHILSTKKARSSPLPARADDEGQRAQQMTRERGEG